jgi:hypothetical protein
VAAQLAASQEGLSSVKLVSYMRNLNDKKAEERKFERVGSEVFTQGGDYEQTTNKTPTVALAVVASEQTS